MTINNDDLLKEISYTSLKEMSDLDGDDNIHQEVINDAINDALSFISSFFKLPLKPTSLLMDLGIKLSVIELKKRNGHHNFKDDLERIESLLLKMSQKKLPIEVDDNGSTPAPSIKNRAFRHNYKKPLNLDGMQWLN